MCNTDFIQFHSRKDNTEKIKLKFKFYMYKHMLCDNCCGVGIYIV
jgi:hypothetical protein